MFIGGSDLNEGRIKQGGETPQDLPEEQLPQAVIRACLASFALMRPCLSWER